MDKLFYLIGGPLLLISVTAHIYVRIRLRPKDDSDLDDYYYEFEEQHPTYARYLFWSRITFAAIALATLLLFLAVAV
jgi:hypothetical protein